MSGSLQQNAIDASINEWRKRLRARVRPDRKHLEQLLWASYQTENEVQLTLFIFNKVFLTAEFVIFRVLKFPNVRYVH